MSADNLRDIQAFVLVARERSFTRAAKQLGVSPSALSHTIRALEARLGLRLLTRTTRSVAPNEAGERLLQSISPRMEAIAEAMASVNEPTQAGPGTVRIAASDFAWRTVLWPRLSALQAEYPQLCLDLVLGYGNQDGASGGVDAWVRFGGQVSSGVTSTRISPDIGMVLVAAPSYLAGRGTPRSPDDLTRHACISLEMAGGREALAWELKKGAQSLRVQVQGPWRFNSPYAALEAAAAGYGVALLPEQVAAEHLGNGALRQVMKGWSTRLPGLHIVHRASPANFYSLALVVECLSEAD